MQFLSSCFRDLQLARRLIRVPSTHSKLPRNHYPPHRSDCISVTLAGIAVEVNRSGSPVSNLGRTNAVFSRIAALMSQKCGIRLDGGSLHPCWCGASPAYSLRRSRFRGQSQRKTGYSPLSSPDLISGRPSRRAFAPASSCRAPEHAAPGA